MKNKQIKKIATFLIFFSIFCQTSDISLAKTTKKSMKTTETNAKTIKKTKAKIPINKNGDLSNHLSISEVFPNPKGKDIGKEWIELFNQENRDINLGNWSLNINNPIKNTKPKTIKFNDKTIIKAKSYLIIDASNYKFSILNSNCKIELKNFVGEIIDKIKYENSEENLSLSRIKISGQNKTLTTWTAPTKGIINPIYHEISGKIEEKNINSDKNHQSYLRITTNDNKPLTINLPTKNNNELLNNTLKEKDQVLFLVEKNKEKQYRLLDFKIEKQHLEVAKSKPTNENWLYYSLIVVAMAVILLIYLNNIKYKSV